MNAEIRVVGDRPNLRLLDDDLQHVDHIASHAKVSLEPVTRDSSSFGNAEQAALVIQLLTDVGVGVVSAAVYDGLRTAIRAASRRGNIRVTGIDPEAENAGDDPNEP